MKGGGRGQSPVPNQNIFFLENKKYAECSETEKYANNFVKFFQEYPLKTWKFFLIFSLNIEICLCIFPLEPFLIFS